MDLFIGIEIGGTKVQVAVGNKHGDLLSCFRDRVDKELGVQGILNWLTRHVPKIMRKFVNHTDEIIAIGCGFGGPIENYSGRVLKSNQISGWDDFSLKDWLEDAFQRPARVENDSNAAAWGEYLKGTGRGTQNFFYTNIGSGIGGGFVFNRELYDSQGFGAGEFGHMLIPNLLTNQECSIVEIEEICSGWSIESRLRKPGYIPETSDLFIHMGNNLPEISTKDLAYSAKTGDTFALEEIDLVARSIAIGLANVLCLTNVERIAIGGGVSKMGDLLIEPIRQHTAEFVFASSQDRYEIHQSKLGDDIVLVGAILLANQAFTRN